MIRTERLLLRPARIDDLDDVHAFLSDEPGALWWSDAAHVDVQQSRGWLASMILGFETNPLDFLIEFEGRVIGKVGCWRLPDVGYRIHSAFWGLGLGREAMRAFLVHLVTTRPDIGELVADVDPRNQASIKLLESLGFSERRFEARTIKTHLGWCDSYYFRLLREQMLLLVPSLSA